MENERERNQMTLGIDSLMHHWRNKENYYIGGNMFIYYSLDQACKVLEEEQVELPLILKERTIGHRPIRGQHPFYKTLHFRSKFHVIPLTSLFR